MSKNFIWTTLKAIFLNIPDFQMTVSRPHIAILTNHTSKESLFKMMYKSLKFPKIDFFMTGFVV